MLHPPPCLLVTPATYLRRKCLLTHCVWLSLARAARTARRYEEAKQQEAEKEAARLAEEKRVRAEKRAQLAQRAAMFNQQ
jgi:hypothetical protein